MTNPICWGAGEGRWQVMERRILLLGFLAIGEQNVF